MIVLGKTESACRIRDFVGSALKVMVHISDLVSQSLEKKSTVVKKFGIRHKKGFFCYENTSRLE